MTNRHGIKHIILVLHLKLVCIDDHFELGFHMVDQRQASPHWASNQ